jgi:SulP family sulfate permease
VVADGMIDDRHDSNQELMAQGIANIVCPFFGGIPATGAIARTAANIRCGAVSPVAGIIHAATLLLVLVVAAPLAKYIPLATLSAVLMVVAFNMGEWEEFRLLLRYPKSDAAVFLTTFALTVIFDLTIAVEIGMILAAFLFIRRISEMTRVSLVDEANDMEGDHHSLRGKAVPEGVLVFSVFGALMFGAAEKLENVLLHSRQEPKLLILRMNKVLAMDATALHTLEHLYEKLHKRGIRLILSGPHTQPYVLMENSGFLDRIGRENVAGDIDDALAKAEHGLAAKDHDELRE